MRTLMIGAALALVPAALAAQTATTTTTAHDPVTGQATTSVSTTATPTPR